MFSFPRGGNQHFQEGTLHLRLYSLPPPEFPITFLRVAGLGKGGYGTFLEMNNKPVHVLTLFLLYMIKGMKTNTLSVLHLVWYVLRVEVFISLSLNHLKYIAHYQY